MNISTSDLRNFIRARGQELGRVSVRNLVSTFAPQFTPITIRAICTELGLKENGNDPDMWMTEAYAQTSGGVVEQPRRGIPFSQMGSLSQLGQWTTGPTTAVNPMTYESLREELMQEIEKETEKTKPVKKVVEFDSVIIGSDKKLQILEALAQIKYNDLIFKEWGFGDVFEKGTAVSLLFHGLPGTGKTLMAQAIADHLEAELKTYGTAEIQSSEPGGAERAIKAIFEEATKLLTGKKKQQVILFDECDSLLSNRASVGVILAAQINALLSEIEKFGGVIIFTTNRLGKLDPALERRIAAKIEFPFPTADLREKIWLRLIPSKAPIAKNVNFKKLSQNEIAGGNIKNVVLNAARMAAFHECKTITMKHFEQAVEREMDSIETFEEEDKKLNSFRGHYHEEVDMGAQHKLEVDEVMRPKYVTKPISLEG